jgi:hypothetical protein
MSVKHDPSRPIPLYPTPVDGLPRRAVLQALLGGAGAAFALPSVLDAQHPMHEHLANASVIEQAQQRAAATDAGPVFLDSHQAKTLEVLAEAIVPGSTGARVGPFLDQLLAVDSAANQRAFLGALGAFDMAAIKRHGQPWIGITPAQQDTLLGEASKADAKNPARGHFDNLKDWIAGAYYSSEAGMRELGWDGNVFHSQLPGCTHPGGHQD